ncbi:25025_t:CDS:1, partial [Gigaspora rosea]
TCSLNNGQQCIDDADCLTSICDITSKKCQSSDNRVGGITCIASAA